MTLIIIVSIPFDTASQLGEGWWRGFRSTPGGPRPGAAVNFNRFFPDTKAGTFAGGTPAPSPRAFPDLLKSRSFPGSGGGAGGSQSRPSQARGLTRGASIFTDMCVIERWGGLVWSLATAPHIIVAVGRCAWCLQYSGQLGGCGGWGRHASPPAPRHRLGVVGAPSAYN